MRKVFSFLICTILLFVLLNLVNAVLMDDRIYSKNSEFYDNNNQDEYDVLFFGSSHITRSVIPMELWKEYGITSYNLGNLGQLIPVNYWVLKDALNRVKPKVVVIDVYPLSMNEKTNVGSFFGIMHETFDVIPFSITKMQALSDLLDFDDAIQYIFPLEYFHINWENFHSFYSDATSRKSISKGGQLYVSDGTETIVTLNNPFYNSNETYYEEETTAKVYLRKIIELCNDNGVDILLLNTPYDEDVEDVKWNNSAQLIADEYNVNYLNCCKMDSPVNFRVDYYDGGKHVNPSGARSITKIIGKYLREKYNLNLEHSNEIVNRWNYYYEEYLGQKVLDLKRQTQMESYFILLKDSDYDILIDFNSKDILNEELTIELLKNLKIETDKLVPESWILIKAGERAEIYKHEELDNKEISTVLGNMYVDKCDDSISILFDDRVIYSDEQYSDIPDGVLRILVLDSKTHDLLDQCSICYENELKNEVVR